MGYDELQQVVRLQFIRCLLREWLSGASLNEQFVDKPNIGYITGYPNSTIFGWKCLKSGNKINSKIFLNYLNEMRENLNDSIRIVQEQWVRDVNRIRQETICLEKEYCKLQDKYARAISTGDMGIYTNADRITYDQVLSRYQYDYQSLQAYFIILQAKNLKVMSITRSKAADKCLLIDFIS